MQCLRESLIAYDATGEMYNIAPGQVRQVSGDKSKFCLKAVSLLEVIALVHHNIGCVW